MLYSTEFREPKLGFGERVTNPSRISVQGKNIGREKTFAGEKTDFLWIFMNSKKTVSVNVKVYFGGRASKKRAGSKEQS